MRNFQQKKKWVNIIHSKPILIFLLILVVVFTWNVLGFWSKMEETSKNKKIIEDKVSLLKKQKEKLISDISSLNTDEGKEKIFRENFGLAKDGENMIVITDDKNQPITPKTESSSGFFSFIKDFFK